MCHEECNLGYNSDGNIGPVYDAVDEEQYPCLYRGQQSPSGLLSDIVSDKSGGEEVPHIG